MLKRAVSISYETNVISLHHHMQKILRYRWERNWSMKENYFKINFQKTSKALFLLCIITLLWSSASKFQMKKEPLTSRHFVNKPILDWVKYNTKWGRNISELLVAGKYENYFCSLYILLCWNTSYWFQNGRYAN